MPKNGDIRGFFKPEPLTQTPGSQHISQQVQAPLERRSSPRLQSSPMLHGGSQPRASAPVSRDRIIHGSDDEDNDDSDCSLEDLATLMGHARGTATVVPRKEGETPCATPKAKRTAIEFHSSPLSLLSKPKFDMRSLIAHAQKDDATEASSKRAVGLNEEQAPEAESGTAIGGSLFQLNGTSEDAKTRKVRRAVERTEAAALRTQWYFFDIYPEPSMSVRSPFPKRAAKGPWSLLADPKEREQHVQSGLPHIMLAKKRQLPDELFLWIMDEVFLTKSAPLRQEYVNLICRCPEQVREIITVRYLEQMFKRLGASPDIEQINSDQQVRAVPEVAEVYSGRDWSPLKTALELLARIASNLDLDSTTYAAKVLTRMSVDRMVLDNIDVLARHQEALISLVGAVPEATWDDFCGGVTSNLYTGFGEASLRASPLLCMPSGVTKIHELRRRMAIAFFFDDVNLARSHPDETFSLARVIDIFNTDRFRIGRTTNYVQLAAEMHFLNIAVDDGSFNPPVNGVLGNEKREEEKRFNAEVDELARQLKLIWGSVNDAGVSFMSRTEAKSVVEWIQERLVYSVRTRRQPKKSIFDLPEVREEDSTLPQQQAFLRNFIKGENPGDSSKAVVNST